MSDIRIQNIAIFARVGFHMKVYTCIPLVLYERLSTASRLFNRQLMQRRIFVA